MTTALYVADRGTSAFETARLSADVVCAGDSITGWNNFGAVRNWPYPTYPESLQRLCEPSGLVVANGGIAGEVSPNGLGQVRDYLELFPNARYFVVGYGTNDLGMWPEVERTSPRIIENLDGMVRAIREGGRQPMLLNVPHANESMFPRRSPRTCTASGTTTTSDWGRICRRGPSPARGDRLEAAGRAFRRRVAPERGGGAGHRRGGRPGTGRGAKDGYPPIATRVPAR